MEEHCCEIAASVVTGFESIAKEEIEECLGSQVETTRGRACFKIDVKDVSKICELRSVDNLLVVVGRFREFQFSNVLENSLQQMKEFVPQLQWTTGLEVWSAVRTCLSKFQVPKRKRNNHRKAENKPEHSVAELDSGDVADSCPAGDVTNSLTSEVIKSCDEQQITTNDCSVPVNSSVEIPVNGQITINEHDIVNSSVEMPVNGEVITNEHGIANSSVKVPVPGLTVPLFRATCYRTGTNHCFQSPQAAAAFGGAVNDFTGWKVDLEHYDIEVILEIDEGDVCVCIALTTESLHRRNIVKFGNTTLRPTIAYGMLRYCRIKPGDIVCDPMCGGGSIPIEGALGWPLAQHICGDIFEHAPNRTVKNVDAVNKRRISHGENPIVVDVFRWDVCSLPLKDESVDVVVTDMPFGKRSGSWQNNWQLYPKALDEMARVCRRSTGRACLLTFDKKCFCQVFSSVSHLWHRGPTIGINLGGLSACLYLLYRTSTACTQQQSTVCI